MADVPRLVHVLRLLLASPVLAMLLFGQASAAGVDRRMTAYFDCIDHYANPAIRKLVAVRGLLTDSEILGEVTKAERYCQRQIAGALEAVRETPNNGTETMTDDQIRARLRSMSATGYVMTYGLQ